MTTSRLCFAAPLLIALLVPGQALCLGCVTESCAMPRPPAATESPLPDCHEMAMPAGGHHPAAMAASAEASQGGAEPSAPAPDCCTAAADRGADRVNPAAPVWTAALVLELPAPGVERGSGERFDLCGLPPPAVPKPLYTLYGSLLI